MFAYNVFLCIADPGSGSGSGSGLKTKDNSPPLGDCGPSEGTSSPPPQGFCLKDENTKYDYLFMTKIHLMDTNYPTLSSSNLPLRACFFVVLRQQWPRPGTGLMSLLLTGGGWSTSLGGRVKQTGRPAALIRMPVMPGNSQQRGDVRQCVWGLVIASWALYPGNYLLTMHVNHWQVSLFKEP